MYDIAWSKRAVRELKRIHKPDAEKIYTAVQKLRSWPECKNVKPLKEQECRYRLRFGRYRIFFDVDDVVKVVWIEHVKKRDERTY